MRDWDQILLLLFGVAVAGYTGVRGWRLWREIHALAGIGLFLLGLSAVVVPVLLGMVRE